MEPVYWLIILAICIVIEIVTLGLTTIWFAGGALVAFFASLLGGNFTIQLVLFFVTSIVLLYFTRPFAVKHLNSKRVRTNADSLIGKYAKVIEGIDNFNQKGTVTVAGQEWTARADANQKIAPDTMVKILDISGVKLIVTDKMEEA